MKAALILILISLAMPLGAKDPTANDVTVAIAAITDSAICNVAAFLNSPPLELPGSILHFRTNESLPNLLTFQNSDIGTYLAVFMKTRQPNPSFCKPAQLKRGLLNDIAIQYRFISGRSAMQSSGAMVTQWVKGQAFLA